MYLACVELAGRRASSPSGGLSPSRVVQLQFPHFETAKIWARAESSRHRDATGNAAVFQTAGPFVSLLWECEADAAGQGRETPSLACDELVGRA